MTWVNDHPNGARITVWAVPGGSRSEVDGLHDGALRVRLAEPAEGGRANRELERLLKRATKARSVTLLSGAGGRRKTLLLEGIEPKEARRALSVDSP